MRIIQDSLRGWFLFISMAACSISATACGEDKKPPPEPGSVGSECDPEQPHCAEPLLCTTDEDKKSSCTFPNGGECEPKNGDLTNGGCGPDAECVEPGDGGADEVARCLIVKGGECDPEEPYCADGLRCEAVSGGGNKCYEPVVLTGIVSDTSDASAIEGAHVIGIDSEGSAATSVSVSDAEGRYNLEVPVSREDDGTPTDTRFTLRASAQDYQNFPFGIRVALPITVKDAELNDGSWVVENALTDVGLIPLEAAERYAVSGHLNPVETGDGGVSGSDLSGVLVVATGDAGAFSATTDKDGTFTIFNVPDGDYEVSAYAAELQVTPGNVSVNGKEASLNLDESPEKTVTVSGNIQIVNAPGGAKTSVILVVDDTFEENAARGEVPRGLRAPRTGAPNVDGDFTIEGVPNGRYVVLAAYENDDLVRDPDTNIAGTDFVYLDVDAASGSSITVDQSFKVTEALAVMSPGADGPESVKPGVTLTWADDSSEDWYEVRVFNAFGDEVWSDLNVPGVSGKSDVSVNYAGPMDPGMYYQFRVLSWRQPGKGDAAPISATEDLRGVFFSPAQ